MKSNHSLTILRSFIAMGLLIGLLLISSSTFAAPDESDITPNFSAIDVDGNSTVGGSSSVTGNTYVGGILTTATTADLDLANVAPNSIQAGDIIATRNVVIDNKLFVDGTSHFGMPAIFEGGAEFNAATTMNAPLDVTDNSNFTGSSIFSDSVIFDGDVTFNGTVSGAAIGTTDADPIFNSVQVDTTLNVDGAATLESAQVNTTLNVDEESLFNGDATFVEDVTFNGTDIIFNSDVQFNGTVSGISTGGGATSTETDPIFNTLEVSNESNFNGRVYIDRLDVTGTANVLLDGGNIDIPNNQRINMFGGGSSIIIYGTPTHPTVIDGDKVETHGTVEGHDFIVNGDLNVVNDVITEGGIYNTNSSDTLDYPDILDSHSQGSPSDISSTDDLLADDMVIAGGDIEAGGNLEIAGTSQFDGAAQFDGSTTFNGNPTFNSLAYFSTLAATGYIATGDIISDQDFQNVSYDGSNPYLLGGSIVSTKNVAVDDNLYVDGNSEFGMSAEFYSTTTFDGTATFDGAAEFNGASQFDASTTFNGNPTFNSLAYFSTLAATGYIATGDIISDQDFQNVSYDGTSTYLLGGTIVSTKHVAVDDNLYVDGTSEFGLDATFNDYTTFNNDATFNNDTIVNGDAAFLGGTTFDGEVFLDGNVLTNSGAISVTSDLSVNDNSKIYTGTEGSLSISSHSYYGNNDIISTDDILVDDDLVVQSDAIIMDDLSVSDSATIWGDFGSFGDAFTLSLFTGAVDDWTTGGAGDIVAGDDIMADGDIVASGEIGRFYRNYATTTVSGGNGSITDTCNSGDYVVSCGGRINNSGTYYGSRRDNDTTCTAFGNKSAGSVTLYVYAYCFSPNG